ncbi:hypothetical protein [Pseudactinotalea sp.]|uniref:hypothetical protein n=1 Tax=Pseudactinotalea sp. TaxID=1926260 RepID=UPI003B3B75B8
MGHRRTFALVAAVGALLLTGCGGGGDHGDDPENSGDGASGASTSIDAALLECGDPENADPTMQLSDVDLTAATWGMPTGFAETFAYSEDLPVEHIESFWAAEPAEDPVTRNVLAVVVYSGLDWGEDIDECGRVPIAAIDERLESYREGNEAEALTDSAELEIAGLPALEQDLALTEYSYRGYWVFSRSQLIHLYCQWTSDAEKDKMLGGCDELVDSLEVAGA